MLTETFCAEDGSTNSVTNNYVFANSTMSSTIYENGHIFRGGVNFRF